MYLWIFSAISCILRFKNKRFIFNKQGGYRLAWQDTIQFLGISPGRWRSRVRIPLAPHHYCRFNRPHFLSSICQMPPRVEYQLTSKGQELVESIFNLPQWILKWSNK